MRTVIGPAAAVAALLSAGVSAQSSPLRYCPANANGICYSVGVPEVSASSESGNIYFQLSAPTTYQWVALGTGSQMQGSNIFIMYQDGQGNVTISNRIGPNHQMPTLDTSPTAAQLTVLAGSGVSADGKTMTANVMCANCESWNGGAGHLSLKDTQSSWVSSWRQGSPIDSTSKSVNLIQHDDTDIFGLDLTKAAITADSNPFVGAPASSGGGGGGDDNGGSSQGGSGGDGDGDGDDNGGDGVTVIGSGKMSNSVLVAHGVIMAIVFAILYPLGSLLMPILGKWWAHGAFQIIVWGLMWAGFGLGIRYAKYLNILFDQTHTILGTVVVCLLAIQPGLGYAHHRHFVKHGGRGIVSHVHIWYGRVLMILGVVNGGLGLQLALAPTKYKIAYAVVAGVIYLIYAVAKTGLSFRRKRAGGPGSADRLGSGTGRKHEAGRNSPA